MNRGEWRQFVKHHVKEILKWSDKGESHKNKTARKGRLPKEGDVVVVHEDGVKRGHWKMGVIEGLIRG